MSTVCLWGIVQDFVANVTQYLIKPHTFPKSKKLWISDNIWLWRFGKGIVESVLLSPPLWRQIDCMTCKSTQCLSRDSMLGSLAWKSVLITNIDALILATRCSSDKANHIDLMNAIYCFAQVLCMHIMEVQKHLNFTPYCHHFRSALISFLHPFVYHRSARVIFQNANLISIIPSLSTSVSMLSYCVHKNPNLPLGMV